MTEIMADGKKRTAAGPTGGISEAVRVERARRRISQVALAREAGVSTARVSEIECGHDGVTIRTAEKIARVLGHRLALVPMDMAS